MAFVSHEYYIRIMYYAMTGDKTFDSMNLFINQRSWVYQSNLLDSCMDLKNTRQWRNKKIAATEQQNDCILRAEQPVSVKSKEKNRRVGAMIQEN